MGLFGRLLAALLILAAIPFHGLVPAVKITEITNPYIYSLLSGADPLVTAYVDAGWLPAMALLVATLCLLGSFIGTLMGERWAAHLVMLAAIADAISLYLANTLGYTALGFSILQIAGLGGGMVLLWLFVRAVTKEV